MASLLPMKTEMIRQRLLERFPDADVDVTDLTGTENHYQVFVQSKAFVGLSRIQQQKAVMNVFESELKTGELHALTMKTTVK